MICLAAARQRVRDPKIGAAGRQRTVPEPARRHRKIRAAVQHPMRAAAGARATLTAAVENAANRNRNRNCGKITPESPRPADRYRRATLDSETNVARLPVLSIETALLVATCLFLVVVNGCAFSLFDPVWSLVVDCQNRDRLSYCAVRGKAWPCGAIWHTQQRS